MTFADLKNDFVFRRIFGTAREAEGEAKGRTASILAILAARGIPVSSEIRARIAACKDMTMLELWLVRATTSMSAAEIFARPAERP